MRHNLVLRDRCIREVRNRPVRCLATTPNTLASVISVLLNFYSVIVSDTIIVLIHFEFVFIFIFFIFILDSFSNSFVFLSLLLDFFFNMPK